MAEPEWTGEDGGGPEPYELPEGVKPIPPDAWRGTGGCGFTGCMYAAVVFAAIAVLLLVIGLLTRQWVTPPISPR